MVAVVVENYVVLNIFYNVYYKFFWSIKNPTEFAICCIFFREETLQKTSFKGRQRRPVNNHDKIEPNFFTVKPKDLQWLFYTYSKQQDPKLMYTFKYIVLKKSSKSYFTTKIKPVSLVDGFY